MIKPFKKNSLSLLVFVILFVSLAGRAEALSFDINPINILYQASNTIAARLSGMIDYLIIQKKYLIDKFTDPNIYNSLDISTNLDKFLASTTSPVSVEKEITSSKPVVVTTTVIPDIKKTIPVGNDSDILVFTNKERLALSLEPLLPNSTLDIVASGRVDDLFNNQYFAHESPDGKSAVDLAQKIGYSYSLIGENLALGDFGDEQGIVTAWMNSPGHKANILNSHYKELGVAIKSGVYNGEDNIIAVQVFGSPLANCPKPNPEIKALVDSSSVSIKKMQSDALIVFNNLSALKKSPGVDQSYYNQKIQEYNFSAKKVNDAVAALKSLIDSYNLQISKYNICIGSN